MDCAAGERRPNSAADAHRRRLQALAAAASIEITPQDELAGERLGELFEPGRTVFVSAPASATHHAIVAAAARLRRAGFIPVPHVAARRLVSFTQARDFLERAAGEAAVEEILLIGGDPETPAGPFGSSLDLLTSGVVERCGMRRIAFAGYPEGHPRIATPALDRALAEKLALAASRGLDASIVTQFGFAPAPIHRFVARLRQRGVLTPVRVGIAGPATVATLAKFAVRCGVGASLRALARGHTAFARILSEQGPEALVDALLWEEEPDTPIAGLHVFTFGGVRRTAAWLSERT